MDTGLQQLSVTLKNADTTLASKGKDELESMRQGLEAHIGIAEDMLHKVEQLQITKATNLQTGMCVVFGSDTVYKVDKLYFGRRSKAAKPVLFARMREMQYDGLEIYWPTTIVFAVKKIRIMEMKTMSYREGVLFVKTRYAEWQKQRRVANGK